MPARPRNAQSGVVVVFILFLHSALGLTLGLLSSSALSARDAGLAMSRHEALRPLAAELTQLADETHAVAQAVLLDAADTEPTASYTLRWQWTLVFAELDQRLAALESRMLALGAALPDATARTDLLAGLEALRLMRGTAASAEKELMIFITPRVVSQVQIPDQGSILIGGLKAK